MTAKSNHQTNESFAASASAVSALQYHVARLIAADTVTLAGSQGNTDLIGVFQQVPSANGDAATVCLNGMTPIVCGSSISVNALITVSASGRAVGLPAAPASGSNNAAYVIGRVLEASGADGDIVTAWVHAPYKFVQITP